MPGELACSKPQGLPITGLYRFSYYPRCCPLVHLCRMKTKPRKVTEGGVTETRPRAALPTQTPPRLGATQSRFLFFISWHMTLLTKLLGRGHKTVPGNLQLLVGSRETKKLSLESAHRSAIAKAISTRLAFRDVV